MTNGAEVPFVRARLIVGALFVRDEEVLLVHTIYRGEWAIPGGYADPGESPTAACRRRIREQLGLDRPPQRLLVHDWASAAGTGDETHYVFDCGALGDESTIELPPTDIDRYQWVRVDTLDDFMIPGPACRIWHAFRARLENQPFYLEDGKTALVHPTTDLATPAWFDRQRDRDQHLG
ncbi:NUDIX domain-containing protein [Nocardia australiensis]|uniref:NUDIX domain-containing protein n=1 Tax=Nocardia australiensis TaxID=2887191 RepID=UPI001D152FFF|nr:NUDIX hydrolase [Nocardia australiensis]